jgi:hypothetical protein
MQGKTQIRGIEGRDGAVLTVTETPHAKHAEDNQEAANAPSRAKTISTGKKVGPAIRARRLDCLATCNFHAPSIASTATQATHKSRAECASRDADVSRLLQHPSLVASLLLIGTWILARRDPMAPPSGLHSSSHPSDFDASFSPKLVRSSTVPASLRSTRTDPSHLAPEDAYSPLSPRRLRPYDAADNVSGAESRTGRLRRADPSRSRSRRRKRFQKLLWVKQSCVLPPLRPVRYAQTVRD